MASFSKNKTRTFPTRKFPWRNADQYDYQEIKDLYDKNYTKTFIASHLNIDRKTLNKIFKYFRWD